MAKEDPFTQNYFIFYDIGFFLLMHIFSNKQNKREPKNIFTKQFEINEKKIIKTYILYKNIVC